MGKKINVFRENDVEHLKAYLIEAVREVILKEEEFQTMDPDAIAKVLGDRAEEVARAFIRVMAEEEVKQHLPAEYDAGKSVLLSSTEEPGSTKGELGLEKSIEIGVPHKEVDIGGFSGNLRSYVWQKLKEQIEDAWSVEFYPPTKDQAKYGGIGGKFEFQDLGLTLGQSQDPDGGNVRGYGQKIAGSKESGGGRVFATLKIRMAKGTGSEKDPNRGELVEALLVLAITKRFINLPEDKPAIQKGALQGKIPGLVTPDEVLEFLANDCEKNENSITLKGGSRQIKGPPKEDGTAPVDTITMKIQLRGYSVDGVLDKSGKVPSFIQTDAEMKKLIKGCCRYANHEVIKWALGAVQSATAGTEDEGEEASGASQLMGWYVNEFNNTIFVGAVGTDAQSLTKVDLKMTCKDTAECPIDAGQLDVTDATKQTAVLSKLSLKGASATHFGAGAATTPEKAVAVMEDVFKGFSADPDVSAWVAKVNANPSSWDSEKPAGGGTSPRMEELNEMVGLYGELVKDKLDKRDRAAIDFVDNMVEGLLKHSVEGKGKFAGEKVLGVDIKGEGWQTLDWHKLPTLIKNLNLQAKVIKTGSDIPYVTLYDANSKLGEPSKTSDEHVLFTVRPLGRVGGEQIRLEKGGLMATTLKVAPGEQVVWRNGQAQIEPVDAVK